MTIYHIDSEQRKNQIGTADTIDEALSVVVTYSKKMFTPLRGTITTEDKGSYYNILANNRILNYIVEK